MEKVTTQKIDIEHSESTRKLKGKNIISRSGEILGKVRDVVFLNKNILGVLLRKRFREDVFIGIEMVESITEDAILLSIDPVTSLIGLPVFDKAGKKIGRVRRVIRQDDRNSFTSIAVKPGLLRRVIEIDVSDIKTISQHIILKVEV